MLWIKAGGAAVGSSLAVVFKPGQDSSLMLVKRFIIGTIIGFIFAPFMMDALVKYFAIRHTWDYWLASATLSGMTGYLFLQILFSHATARKFAELAGSPRRK